MPAAMVSSIPSMPLETSPRGTGLRWAAALGIGHATAAVYTGTLGDPLIYDDHVWITRNPAIRHLSPLMGVLHPAAGALVSGRPILSLSLALNYAISGNAPWSYHLANIAIHILAALALFGIVSRSLALRPEAFPRESDRILPAFAVALLWAVHPLQTESVTYVIQRAESLMGLFYFLTLYCFIRGVQSGRPVAWHFLAVAACLLGMATKEVMVTAPLIVLAYDRAFVAGTFRRALRLRGGLYLGLAATWIIPVLLSAGLGRRGVGFGLGYSWWAYSLTEGWVVAHYILLAAWPYPLVLDYGIGIVGSVGDTVPWVIAILMIGAIAFDAFWRRSLLGFAGVWFFLVLAPSSSVVPVAFQPMADHRMYLPLAAVVAVFVGAFWELLGRLSLPLFLGLALVLGAGTVLRNRDYRTETSIWDDTVLRRPSNPRARIALGTALADEGKLAEAAEQFVAALRIDPGDFEARRSLGLVLYRMGRYSDALAQYGRLLPPKPDQAPFHHDVALALEAAGRNREAIGEYARALALDPGDTEARARLERLKALPAAR